jgi:hypothetical protein
MVSNASEEHAASIFRKEKSFEEYTSTLKSTPLAEDGGTVFLKSVLLPWRWKKHVHPKRQ